MFQLSSSPINYRVYAQTQHAQSMFYAERRTYLSEYISNILDDVDLLKLLGIPKTVLSIVLSRLLEVQKQRFHDTVALLTRARCYEMSDTS